MAQLFTRDTQAIFWNNNTTAIQRMLDYDYTIKREKPSVAAIVAPTSNSKFDKFFYGPDEIMIPLYRNTTEAKAAQPQADVLLNFASFRTAYEVTMEALEMGGFSSIMVTAEGIPERLARKMNAIARAKNVTVIGPATVGAIAPGAFKIANIGGTIENIVQSKLHRAGSCGLVTRSGGLFNELSNIIAINADGIAEGVAIGGDRFVGSVFIDNLLRMEANPEVKYMLLLGEVGGTEEYKVIEAVKSGQIKKPIIAWCIGTIAKYYDSGVQFGHAGASANGDMETAEAKNKAMKEVGIHVPASFNNLPEIISAVYHELHAEGVIKDIHEPAMNVCPSVRKSKQFICTISDDRGDEAHYCGYPISSVATPDTGFTIGDVMSILWFKKRYPRWAVDFLETVLKTVADHGPAVSGAHNAKVTARAGKDVISSLISGLLTIGPRFGGAIDDAAKYFKYAKDHDMTPNDFLNHMKKEGIPIPGIGHRIKSLKNPDLRVEGLKKYAAANFPSTPLLDYALTVEQLTTSKKENLILNVDGTIGILMVDMWRALGYADEEIDVFINAGALNAFFILGRSIGFIGHILDEKRLGMPMYRHPMDDILYDVKLAENL
ncbi:MAG: citrate/2-methylcitrate synthase [Sulfurimonas sp.]|jgi:ATP-citrate lyase alpha-subunit|uniref:citrate/2-methylcitrate synthase n=1 Tax=unclassified Sulfurimonas TaxID=2623549 RepID=UPI0008C68050|nr:MULTISPECIES: citrate/2-methylcitrate synthase [unclassified Sulfurimonas]MBS4067290.1 ATP citrate synthase [Sulfurimonas sp.]MDD3855514.1 citrate/2-methylcitrate synthase [Sulfurimonas sp.]OHE05448.1 MAG: ATP citrate synthase [Sulfurimonas sp. RIFOXYB12_FULL_35_9]